jgi:hypothetical protein
MSLGQQIADIRRQWAANPRLRTAVGLAGALVALWVVLVLFDWRDALAERYRERSAYMGRLRSLAGQPEWLARSQEAARLRKGLEATIPTAASLGLARAEVQAWARERATATGGQVQIASAEPSEVDGRPGLWRIPVTLTGSAAPQQVIQLMQTVEKSPTLSVVEQAMLLNRENRTFSLTVVFHYRIEGGSA